MEFLRNASALITLISTLILLFGFYQVCRLIAKAPGIIKLANMSDPNMPGWKFIIVIIGNIILMGYNTIVVLLYPPAFISIGLFIADCYITYLGMKHGASLLGVTVGGGISGILGIIASIILRNLDKIMQSPDAKVNKFAAWAEGRKTA